MQYGKQLSKVWKYNTSIDFVLSSFCSYMPSENMYTAGNILLYHSEWYMYTG